MSVTVKRVDGKHCFFELIVETEDGMTVRVPFNGVELEDLERQITRCFEQCSIVLLDDFLNDD